MPDEPTELFQLKRDEAAATGVLVGKQFLVHAGSVARKTINPSIFNYVKPKRDELFANEVLVEDGDGQLRFTKDHLFPSPSQAGAVVMGASSNGWTDWKHSDGRTLSQVKRVARPAGAKMLSDSQRQKIQAKFSELLDDGKAYSDEQLEKSYKIFQNRFGPDVLAELDGETLLTFIHDHGNKDSLVYWLEFKNDEEFDTKRFGSIAGGSALKFRVFRRRETGHWQAGGPQNKPTDISIEEAIDFARIHRDQLLLGVELLNQLPQTPSDEDYAELQDQMDELAPDVSNLAWGHKYFSLICPKKLDDYHNADLQRFHLLKLLQIPPGREGRYICAGRFVSAAAEAGLHINQFTEAINAVNGTIHRYWRVGTRGGKDKVSHWPMMQERDCIAVGWKDLDELSWVETNRESRDKLKALLERTYPDQHVSAIGNDCSQITHFVAGLNEGDIVLAADGATVLGIGRVTGEYRYEPEYDFPHQRPVEWLNFDEWKMPIAEGLRSTVREVKKHSENIVEAERHIRNGNLPVKPAAPSIEIRRNIRLSGIPGRIQSVLDRKGQVILYGPPGTGKTYWAEKSAHDLGAISSFGKRFSDLDESQKAVVAGDDESPGLVRMCCFHPAYGYEDFLEGYRPFEENGQMFFKRNDGIFKKLCDDAREFPDRKYFLIIDEINRGDIPRIFGELLTTLEKDKRGKRIILPVSQCVFSVPRNVLLIGTMNTADRSISLLDAALRRRFGFIEMMPDGTPLGDANISGIPLRAWFEALNERIRQYVGRDARNLQIGHSYLMQAGSPIKDIAPLKRAIRDDIIPLLEEYCYENYTTLKEILGKDLVDVAMQRVRHELFDDGQEEALVQGILSEFSGILSSTEAILSDKTSVVPDDDEGDEDSE